MTKYYIQTWGCQMNVYDSDRIRSLLDSCRYTETTEITDADIVLLVTCAIREKAQEKVFSQLFSWKSSHSYKENAIVCVGGCVASQEGDKILKRAPMVNIVFGPQTIHRLPAMIEAVMKDPSTKKVDVSFPAIEKFDFLPTPKNSGVTAFVTIMEGCSNFCSYCVVPYTRGPEVSRNVTSILNEISALTAAGAREINLLGQNVNSYHGLFDDGSECSFSELLYLVATIDGVERLRFTTSNPHDLSPEVIQAFAELPQLANAIHLPVQNGSNRVLKNMNRKYTRERYIKLTEELRAVRPDISISTDFIVGFPGETQADFEDTLDLIRTVKFDQSFSFIYSPRPNTPAAEMEDDTPLEVKKQRLYDLQALINNQAQIYSREMVDTVQKVLVDGFSVKDQTELRGRTDNNRTVNFAGAAELIGSFVEVKITDAMSHTLRGDLVHK